MDLSQENDKHKLAYILVSEQRVLASAQQNCQRLEARIAQIEAEEQAENEKKASAAAEKSK